MPPFNAVKPVVDFIFVIIKLFSLSLTVGRYERKSVEVGVAHQPLLVSEYQSNCPFVWYQSIRSASFSFVTMHACDRQTDGQNYDSQDRACIAARAVKAHNDN